jgi:uncharacterized SAM-dependent methyltransferase
LKALNRENYTFDYMPVDISQNALDNLEADLNIQLPSLSIKKNKVIILRF